MSAERLFFALWPPRATRAELDALRGRLPGAPGRPTDPADLHLTLVFLGAVDAARRACAEAAAERVAGVPFELSLDQAGWWQGPRVRWCAPLRPPSALLALQRRLTEALADCGFVPERRPYRPHVTLARKAPMLAPMPLAPSIAWPVDRFVLARSHGGQRPAYEVLRRWPLHPRRAPGGDGPG